MARKLALNPLTQFEKILKVFVGEQLLQTKLRQSRLRPVNEFDQEENYSRVSKISSLFQAWVYKNKMSLKPQTASAIEGRIN